MTDVEFAAWLESNDACPCVLVEAVARSGGVEVTRYMSDMGYTTSPTDVPANTSYDAIIVGGCETFEDLGVEGTAELTVGDIEIANVNGERASWLTDIWQNRTVNMYIGDMRWSRAEFRQVFSGVSKVLTSKSRNVLNLEIRDKLQRLNTVVSETLLGGSTQNAERYVPVTLGEVHNIEPLLVDPALLKFKWHKFQGERLIEVRDDGLPVAHTPNLADSTFTLAAQNFGRVTCSAQGDVSGGYMNTVSRIVQRLATMSPTDPFTNADLDLTNLNAFDIANPQPIGIYISDRDNVLDLCQQAAASVGARPVMSLFNKLKLIKIELPASGVVTNVTPTNMVDGTFELVEKLSVKAGITLGYCKNWTVQTNLQTGIPTEHADLYAQEWLTCTSADTSIASLRKITDKPVQEDTFLLRKVDALAEATRRRLLWNVERQIYQYVGYPELLLQELGAPQFVTHPLNNFQGGKDAQIVGLEKNWLRRRVKIRIMV